MKLSIPRTGAIGSTLLLFFFTSLAAQVYIDYDHDAKFGEYKTYAFEFEKGQQTLEQKDPLMHQRVVDDLKQQLDAGGLKQVTENPDLYVTYHVTSKQDEQINTTSFGYGMGGGWGAGFAWGGGGWGDSTSTVSSYTVGTLIIDIYDAKTKKAIWRGTASGVVPENPKKGQTKIANSIQKLADKWAKMRKGS